MYLANGKDIRTCFDLPDSGFPLGEMVLSEVNDQTSLYYYPYNPSSYKREEDEWLLDHSVFIVGNQGRGKTNALFHLSLLLSCNYPQQIDQMIINLCNHR